MRIAFVLMSLFLLATGVRADESGPHTIDTAGLLTPGFNSAQEVRNHCDRHDGECLRILEGAVGAAITMQRAYYEIRKLKPLFCLDQNPTIEDFRNIFLRYVNKTAMASGNDMATGDFSTVFLQALMKSFPCIESTITQKQDKPLLAPVGPAPVPAGDAPQ